MYYIVLVAAVLVAVAAAFVLLVVLSQADLSRLWWVLEGLVAVLGVILFVFYRHFVRPLDAVGKGVGLLREQDFSSRLRHVGQRDADDIVDMFNAMMASLKEEKLRIAEQDRFLSQIVEASPMGILVLDVSGRIAQMNPAMCRFAGVEGPLTGQPLLSCGVPLLAEAGRLSAGESVVRRMGNQDVFRIVSASFMDRGARHGFFLFERMTEEIFEAERSAYRKVIRVISHEVNNTVAGVGSAVELLGAELARPGDGASAADMEELVSTILARLSGMGRFITNYADMVRLPAACPVPTDPGVFLRGVFPVLESLRCGADVDMFLEVSSPLRVLSFDRVLMEQVLVNVVKNAVEAVCAVHPADGVRGCVRVVAEDGVWRVIDNGGGISDDVAGSLFTPFFSTKANGQGIGLMLVREILSGQGFGFRLFSERPGLTVFEVRF